jgi:acetyl esterase/lipase
MTLRMLVWLPAIAALAQGAPLPQGVRALRDLEYAKIGATSLKLDLYLPEKPGPLVVWIHGGGWRAGDKRQCPLTFLAAEGYAVASVNYRLTDAAVFPAQIHDCKGAIRWLRARSGEHGYDAARVGVGGGSAGGHLAALVGTSGGVAELEGDVGGNRERSSRVQAVLDLFGPSDFTAFVAASERAARPDSPEALLLGGPVAEKKELARLAGPVTHVGEGDPPILILHGSKDPTRRV